MKTGHSDTRSGSIPTTLAEINVIPLVDIMLVLLIVFMVSAPLMQQGVQVDLPKANAGSLNDNPDEVILVVTKKKRVKLNGKLIKKGTLRSSRLPFVKDVLQGWFIWL